eukprot:SAG11_NODE_4385_length_1921_cov_1.347969_2_plen_139_part_00
MVVACVYRPAAMPRLDRIHLHHYIEPKISPQPRETILDCCRRARTRRARPAPPQLQHIRSACRRHRLPPQAPPHYQRCRSFLSARQRCARNGVQTCSARASLNRSHENYVVPASISSTKGVFLLELAYRNSRILARLK